jgi:hypothetical protein
VSKRTVVRRARPHQAKKRHLANNAAAPGADIWLAKVRKLQSRTLLALSAAELSVNLSAVAALVREARRNYELMSKLSELVRERRQASLKARRSADRPRSQDYIKAVRQALGFSKPLGVTQILTEGAQKGTNGQF